MNVTPRGRQPAVLDTSFWLVACAAGVAASCLDLFEVIVPRAVEDELCVGAASLPGPGRPYRALFQQLRHRMGDPPSVPSVQPTPLGLAATDAIALALDLPALLLINERRGVQYAVNLNVRVVSVPSAIIGLRARGLLSNRAARRTLVQLQSITGGEIIAEALRALDSM